MSATLSTGLSWSTGEPRIHLHDEAFLDTGPGSTISLCASGSRQCVGFWSSADGGHDCPFGNALHPGATDSQCPSCAQADSGRRLARGFISDQDERPYRLYLAWFGAVGKIKVGITAQARGTARLLDQGARVYTFIAEGPLPAIRAAEMAVSKAGIATERVRSANKTGGWWADTSGAAAALTATAEKIATTVDLPPSLTPLPPEPVDHTARFGLDGELPDRYRPLDSFTDTDVLSGRVVVAAGKLLLVSTNDGAVLCDTRLLSGWHLTTTEETRSRLRLSEPVRPKRPEDEAPTLF